MTAQGVVERGRELAMALSALLLVASAARFSYVAWSMPSAQTASAGAAGDAVGAVGAVTKLIAESAADPVAAAEPEPEPQAQQALPSAGGEHMRVMLSVRYQGPRSPLYINDMPMGMTSYVGELACRRGEKLTIRIAPARGEPIERMVVCDQPSLSISE